MVPYVYAGLTFVSLLVFFALAFARARSWESLLEVAPEGDHLSFSSRLETQGATPTSVEGTTDEASPKQGRAARRARVRPHRPVSPEEAAELLFRSGKIMPKLLRWLAKLAVPEEHLEDVQQEVLVSAYQSFHTYDPGKGRPERWLNSVAVHVASHFKERAVHRREEPISEETPEPVDEEPGADEVILRGELRRRVLDALSAVDFELRSIVVAYHLDEIPMKEIAEAQGLPLSTVYKRLYRGEVALAAELRRMEEEERAGGQEGQNRLLRSRPLRR